MPSVNPSDKPEVGEALQLVTTSPDEDKPRGTPVVLEVPSLVDSEPLSGTLHYQSEAALFEATKHRVRKISGSSVFSEQEHIAALSAIHGEQLCAQLLPMTVLSAEPSQQSSNSSEKHTILVRLQVNEPFQLNHESGDRLGVFASNRIDLVEQLIGYLTEHSAAFADLDQAVLQVEVKNEEWETLSRLPPCSLRDALTNYLDISGPPDQSFLGSLSLMTSDDDHKRRLNQLSQNIKEYENWRP
ncbi:Nitric oxide synthase, brain [Halotydeus destructor]|nr:Nitric oxide synthase, brain [Halotydeus destructor]